MVKSVCQNTSPSREILEGRRHGDARSGNAGCAGEPSRKEYVSELKEERKFLVMSQKMFWSVRRGVVSLKRQFCSWKSGSPQLSLTIVRQNSENLFLRHSQVTQISTFSCSCSLMRQQARWMASSILQISSAMLQTLFLRSSKSPSLRFWSSANSFEWREGVLYRLQRESKWILSGLNSCPLCFSRQHKEQMRGASWHLQLRQIRFNIS